jgi:hypothetical protein
MKTISTLLITMVLATVGFSQRVNSKDVPAPVTAAFDKAHPGVKGVEWSKNGKYYKAEYDQKALEFGSTYDIMGKMISEEMEISRNDLMQSIKDYASSHYAGKRIREATKVTSAGGVVTYYIDIAGMEVTFDSKGNYLSERKDED